MWRSIQVTQFIFGKIFAANLCFTVIKTFEKDLLTDDLNALKPLERVDIIEGVAPPDEVQRVVANRKGSILSASTILKSDYFSNLQKRSLPEYVGNGDNRNYTDIYIVGVSKALQTSGEYPLPCSLKKVFLLLLTV